MPNKVVIKTAIDAAKSSNEEFRVGAALFKGAEVLRAEPNSNKFISFPARHFNHKPTRHAEISVINGIPRDVLEKCSILVVRLNRKDELVLAKPCDACQRVLNNANIRRIYFTNEYGEIEKL